MTPRERIEELLAGGNPRLIARLPSGFAVMHAWQHWPGYCLLIAEPMALNLNALEGRRRLEFLSDMAFLGDAITRATGAVRINYSIYGNLDPFLHAHVVPRYENEAEAQRTTPPLAVPSELRETAVDRYDEGQHGILKAEIARYLFEFK
jgi:diadenosine tetraphosphate (Ap4A) HIT family hydrolase